MDWFEKVNRYYNGGFYTLEQVRAFVKAKKITKEDFTTITGLEY